MENILSYDEAMEIYHCIQDNLDKTDEDFVGLYQDMVKKAVRYAHIRAEWLMLSREQKREQDSTRTIAHDAFIASVNIISRIEGDVGKVWRTRLSDDRKRVGDFACYIALFESLQAR